MGFTNRSSKFFQDWDDYSQPITVRYNKKKKYPSCVGGFISIAVNFAILWWLCNVLNENVSNSLNESSSYQINSVIDSNTTAVPLTVTNFDFMV